MQVGTSQPILNWAVASTLTTEASATPIELLNQRSLFKTSNSKMMLRDSPMSKFIIKRKMRSNRKPTRVLKKTLRKTKRLRKIREKRLFHTKLMKR